MYCTSGLVASRDLVARMGSLGSPLRPLLFGNSRICSCIYIYVYIHAYTYIYICISVFLNVCIHVYIYIYIYVYASISIHTGKNQISLYPRKKFGSIS